MHLIAQVDLGEGITNAFSGIATIVPRIIVAIIILIVGRIIAGIVAKLVTAILGKINFDSWIDKSGLGAPIERAGFADSGALVAKAIYWLIMLIAINWAVGIFGDTPLRDVLYFIIEFIPKLIIAVAIIIITGIIANFVRGMLTNVLAGAGYAHIVSLVAVGFIWFIGVSSALDILEFATDILDTIVTTVFASLGLILVIKFGIGGIDSARDRFWPKVYDLFEGKNDA